MAGEQYGDMQINLVGVSHHTLALAGREKLARFANDPQQALTTLAKRFSLSEAALISTCNRFEIVSVGADHEQELNNFIREELAAENLTQEGVYRLRNKEAVRHLFKVASSLDSLALGEAQILGQVKDAYRHSVDNGLAGRYIHTLFQSAFQFAKKVREHTAVAEGGVSIAFVAVKLAEQIFGDLGNARVVVVGAGKTAELTALHLRSKGCSKISVVNRTLERAVELANHIGGSALPLSELHAVLENADIIVGSITADTVIVDAQMVRALKRQRPLFFIDLGVPRNFSPTLGELDDVYLYSIDDLSAIAEKNSEVRVAASKDAEIIVEYGLVQFERWLARLRAEPKILALRDRIHTFVREEVAHTIAEHIPQNEREALAQKLSYRIGQKVAHELQELSMLADGASSENPEAEIERLFALFFDRLWG